MKKIVLGLSLALLLLIGVGKVSAQMTSTAMVSSQASLSAPLSIGSQGTAVTMLQQFLITKGYLNASAPTGYYGNLTSAAVAKFQAANSLPQVGRVGPMTLALLNQQLGGVVSQQQANASINPNANIAIGPSANPAENTLIQQQQASAGNGCVAGDMFSPTTGQPCTQQPTTITGCTGTNLYSTVTGQQCAGTPKVSQQYSQSQQQNTATVITSPSSDPVSASNTTATLTGQWPADTAGTSAVGWFNYGTSATNLNQSTSQVALGSFAINQGIFSASISNLEPNTTYYYEVEVSIQPEGMGDDVTGLPVSFTTGGSTTSTSTTSTAVVTTLPANVASGQVTLNGTFSSDPWGNGGAYTWFQYGTNSNASNTGNSTMTNATTWHTDAQLPAAMTEVIPMSSLQSNTTYYYEACAGVPSPHQCGQILNFTTGGSTSSTSTVPPTITVVNPVAGATWYGGSTYVINWTSQNVTNGGVYLQLCLVSNLSQCADMTPSPTGSNPPVLNGGGQATVPLDASAPSVQAEVKVISDQNSSVFGYSAPINVVSLGGFAG